MKILKNILALTFLLSAASAGSVKACQCLPPIPRDFFESFYINFYHWSASDTNGFILKGQIVSLTPGGDGVRMKVLKKYYGTYCTDTVTIHGSTGIDCLINPQQYYHTPNNDTIIAMIGKSGNDFFIGSCGPNVLEVKNDSVFGGWSATAFSAYGYPLNLFEDSLYKRLQHLAVNSVVKPKIRFDIYPNPVADEIHIRDGFSQLQEITLIDVQGKIIYQASVTGSRATIPVKDYPPGLYLLRIQTTGGELHTEKISIR